MAGLYKGLSAGLLRQATYTTARLGIFKIINEEAIKMNDNKPLPLYQKLLCGLTAGGIGAFVGTPADLTLIRMQSGARSNPQHVVAQVVQRRLQFATEDFSAEFAV